MTNVTKTFFPPFEDCMLQFKRIWENEWLTNRGALVLELEEMLHSYLGLDQSRLIVMNNGTVPLQIALKLLAKQGEVITTPFSYIATSAAIMWENCTPVFVDIHPEYLTIDETKIEDAITSKTTCILATHVFGNPCNIDEIDRIAQKYNLRIIYDAAHCFAVKYKNISIFEYGDISTCSFHATKLFHTAEGGALFTKDSDLFHQSFYSHNFGHNGPDDFFGLGINGKISELNAALGLSVLPYMNRILIGRKNVVDFYNENINWGKISKIKLRQEIDWNYSYYPIIFNSENELLTKKNKLNELGINPRRYFFPSLNTCSFLNKSKASCSEDISKRILCLPLFMDISLFDLQRIVNIINI